MSLVQVVALIFLVSAILLDLFTLYLAMVSNKRGYGPSGVPVLSWMIYFFYCAFLLEESFMLKLFSFTALTVFHILCQFVIPAAQVKFISRKRKMVQ